MKRNKIIIILAVLAGCAYLMLSINEVIAPYLSFKRAKESIDYIQVIGKIDRDKPVSVKSETIEFVIKNKSGERLNVSYAGSAVDLQQNEDVVVMGTYSKDKDSIISDRILVKCPSKYKKK